MATGTPQEISAAEAVGHFSKFDLLDPQGLTTAADVCQRGTCFEMDCNGERMVFVLEANPHKLWILAAAGHTEGGTARTLRAIEGIADKASIPSVGFQTARAGLAKLAEKNGYRVTGWVLSKDLKNADS